MSLKSNASAEPKRRSASSSIDGLVVGQQFDALAGDEWREQCRQRRVEAERRTDDRA